MAVTVRLSKAEVAKLREGTVPGTLIDKIDGAELLAATKKNAPRGLPPQVAVEAFKEVLGDRLVLPPGGANGVWGALGARLRALGLTRDDCVLAARAAAAEWRPGPIRAESLVRQADVLLGAKTGVPIIDSVGSWQGALAPEDE